MLNVAFLFGEEKDLKNCTSLVKKILSGFQSYQLYISWFKILESNQSIYLLSYSKRFGSVITSVDKKKYTYI